MEGVRFAFSEIIKDNLNPVFRPIELDVDKAGKKSKINFKIKFF